MKKYFKPMVCNFWEDRQAFPAIFASAAVGKALAAGIAAGFAAGSRHIFSPAVKGIDIYKETGEKNKI